MKAAQIKGYRSQLVAAIRQCQNGAIVELDLSSAKGLLQALDHLLSGEPNK